MRRKIEFSTVRRAGPTLPRRAARYTHTQQESRIPQTPTTPRRRLRLAGAVILFVLVLATAGTLIRLRIPPSAARLLPECDAIVYLDLKPIRAATHLETRPVPHSPDYQAFIDATGIVFERDLDSVAFALTRMPDPNGPNGPVAFSEVFTGSFDSARLATYLTGIATARESYAGYDVFTVPIAVQTVSTAAASTGRTLRVARLSSETIAVSNAPTPEQIHAILNRARAGGGLFSGPTLLSALYSEVPYLSSIWGIGALGLPFAEDGRVTAFGLHLPLADNTPFVASLRYTGSIHLRIEQIAGTQAEAERSAQKLGALLSIVRQMQGLQAASANEKLVREFLDSLAIHQKNDRAILTATIPVDLLRTITQTAPTLRGNR